MKVLLTIYIASLCLSATFALCPQGCVCSVDTCDSCQPDHFNGNTNVTGIPHCLKCPIGCSACEAGNDGHPVCTACDTDNGWNLGNAEGRCFQCDPECISCSGRPDNCDACFEPFVHVVDPQDNTVGHCIVDKFCEPRCASCNGSDLLRMAEMNGQRFTQQEIDALVYCQ